MDGLMRVFKVAAISLRIVLLASLQQYEKLVERLALHWPQAWGFIVLAEDRRKAQRLEKSGVDFLQAVQRGENGGIEILNTAKKDPDRRRQAIGAEAIEAEAIEAEAKKEGIQAKVESSDKWGDNGHDLAADPRCLDIMEGPANGPTAYTDAVLAVRPILVAARVLESLRKHHVGEIVTLENPPGNETGPDIPFRKYEAQVVNFNSCTHMEGKQSWWKPARWAGR
eukprot:s4531_g5.t1